MVGDVRDDGKAFSIFFVWPGTALEPFSVSTHTTKNVMIF